MFLYCGLSECPQFPEVECSFLVNVDQRWISSEIPIVCEDRPAIQAPARLADERKYK
jgi:hypothetical protein